MVEKMFLKTFAVFLVERVLGNCLGEKMVAVALCVL